MITAHNKKLKPLRKYGTKGYILLRFSESQVVYRMDDVVTEIDYAITCLEESVDNRL